MSGAEYMKDNPERFIESNTENCWIEYLRLKNKFHLETNFI